MSLRIARQTLWCAIGSACLSAEFVNSPEQYLAVHVVQQVAQALISRILSE
jgi:hypothetical protein